MEEKTVGSVSEFNNDLKLKGFKAFRLKMTAMRPVFTVEKIF